MDFDIIYSTWYIVIAISFEIGFTAFWWIFAYYSWKDDKDSDVFIHVIIMPELMILFAAVWPLLILCTIIVYIFLGAFNLINKI